MNTTTIQEQLKKHYQKLQARLQKAQSKGRSQSFQELLMSRIQRCAIQLRQLGAGVAVVTALGWAAPALGQNTIPLQYEEKVGVDNPLDTVSVNDSRQIVFADLDGDGDKDLVKHELVYISYGVYESDFDYYENVGDSTMPVFELRANSTMLDTLDTHAIGLSFVDIDGDGDKDLFVADESYFSGKSTVELNYYENTSLDPANPEFTLQPMADNPLQDAINFYSGLDTSTTPIMYTNFIDIDNDGDQDCFIAPLVDPAFQAINDTNRVVYYKNEGSKTMPNFQRQSASNNPLNIINTTIPTGGFINEPFFIFDGDLERDKDLDILVRSNSTIYFRNIGSVNSPNFITSATTPVDSIWMNTSVRPERIVAVSDLTSDGKAEVVYFDRSTRDLRYFVDTVSTLLNQFVLQGAKHLEVYPNPSTGLIQLEQSYTGLLEVYTATGQLVYKKELEEVEQLNLELLDTGIYVVSLQTLKERFVQQITIIK
ncbi:MAG: T9SS type A sorting domain-containing protein [Aureispira sp.]